MLVICAWAIGAWLCPGAAGASPAAGVSAEAVGSEIDPRIASQVEAILKQETANLPGQLALRIAPLALGNRPACNDYEVYKPGGFRLRPRMTLGLRCVAPQRWSAYVAVQATLLGRYPVAAQMLAVGDALPTSALTLREGDLLALPSDAVLNPDRLAGWTARQRIAVGMPIRAGALRSADAVRRGMPVKLVLHGSGFTVSRDGVAIDEGAPGSAVQVRTPAGQIVSGIVRGGGTVEVGLP